MSRFGFAAFALTMLAVPAAAQTESGGYVVTLGRDTISAESYTRRGNIIEGVITRRSPRVVVVRYTLELQPNSAWTLAYNTRLPDGAMLPNGAQRIAVAAQRERVNTRIVRDAGEFTNDVQALNPFPAIDGAISFYRVGIAALEAMRADSADFHAYPAGATLGEYMPIAKKGARRYSVYSFGSPIEVTTDGSGSLLTVDGSRTTVRTQTRRVPGVDVVALATAWGARERAAGAMGALSPNDSTLATVGAARVRIEYGRPALRGRTVWGPNGVLGDSIWRTGANASTKLIVDAPVTIGGKTLAAGRYVLTTLAIPGRYQLIVSQENVEIARVPLTAAPIAPSVERFTIAIEGGRLRLRWDTLELSTPMT